MASVMNKGGNKMKKLLFGAMLLALAISVPIPTMAQVSVQIGIPLPPLIAFPAPPAVILLPNTGIYVAPDLAVDFFFFDGWWWRPWEGRWYRSRNYRSGWGYYNGVPSFYGRVPYSIVKEGCVGSIEKFPLIVYTWKSVSRARQSLQRPTHVSRHAVVAQLVEQLHGKE